MLKKAEFGCDGLPELAKKCGFTHCLPLDLSTLEFMQEIREMCNPEKCGNYNKSWSCPPACPTIDEMRDRAEEYACGLLVQTVGDIEDGLDWDGMMSAEARHKESFSRMRVELEARACSVLALASGCCKLCPACSYPQAPCRNPDRMAVSMEASGLYVSKVCSDNKLGYNYGLNKISFTGCFLFSKNA